MRAATRQQQQHNKRKQNFCKNRTSSLPLFPWVTAVTVVLSLSLVITAADSASSTSSPFSTSSWFHCRDRRHHLLHGGSSTTAATSSTTSTLPRSSSSSYSNNNLRNNNNNRCIFPPWNLSDRIDDRGFLKQLYARIPGDWEPQVKLRTSYQKMELPVRIRQVPGDGNCLFHSISLCLRHAVNGTHWNLRQKHDLDELVHHSHHLRLKAVQCLRSSSSEGILKQNTNNNKRLFLQGRESLRASELVEAAAMQYQLSSEEYCDCMSQPSVWGGGPEIVALCNCLQRPIHVYELAAQGDQFLLRRMACFGSPKFDSKAPLHILSADSRFPDVQPGHQLAAGNHFLAVFPQRQKKHIRGGGRGNGVTNNNGGDHDTMMEDYDDDDMAMDTLGDMVDCQHDSDDDYDNCESSSSSVRRLSQWMRSWCGSWWGRSSSSSSSFL